MVDDDADSDSPAEAWGQEYSSDVVAMPLPKDVAGDLPKARHYLLLNQKTGCVHIASPDRKLNCRWDYTRPGEDSREVSHASPAVRCMVCFARPVAALFHGRAEGQAITRPSEARTHALTESGFCGGSNFGAVMAHTGDSVLAWCYALPMWARLASTSMGIRHAMHQQAALCKCPVKVDRCSRAQLCYCSVLNAAMQLNTGTGCVDLVPGNRCLSHRNDDVAFNVQHVYPGMVAVWGAARPRQPCVSLAASLPTSLRVQRELSYSLGLIFSTSPNAEDAAFFYLSGFPRAQGLFLGSGFPA